jgi:hypothetical protein
MTASQKGWTLSGVVRLRARESLDYSKDQVAGPSPARLSRAGVSVPVIGVALVLEHLSPGVTLLIFGVAAAVGIGAAAPVLVRADLARPERAAASDGATL